MVASIICIPCMAGDCDDCIPRHPAPKGVLGGSYCPCKHDEEARSRNDPALVRAITAFLRHPAKTPEHPDTGNDR